MARHTRSASVARNPLALAVAAALMPFAQGAQADPAANALPTNGQVTQGSASISQSGASMQITQSTSKAVLQWDSFSIGAAATVNFAQPSTSAIALNRVLGSNPSEIFGHLTANGQVFLSSPSGVLFAPGASVEVGALFATTLSITDADFMAGRYNFYNAGGAGSVVNQGVITATGYAALAGPQVRNDGIIVATSGTVALAAGDRVSLDMIGDGLISVSVDQAAMSASAINAGTIQADGGKVLLTARSANALLDTVVNNSGVIRANSLVARNGEIVLDGGSAGTVANSGALQGAGASVAIGGGNIAINLGTSVDPNASSVALDAAADIAINAPLAITSTVFSANAGHDMNMAAGVNARNIGIAVGNVLTLNAVGQDVRVTSNGGQTIGAGELNLHAENGRRAVLVNNGGDQEVFAGAGGISLDVLNGQGVAQIANNASGIFDGVQTVETTGALSVVGGSVAGLSNSGIFQNQTGKQTVHAGSISLEAATIGSNGGAFIRNTNGGGDQEIQAATSITLKGGENGLANRAGIQTSGNQTILGNADITLSAGSSGAGLNSDNTNNAAFISANTPDKTQTIYAHDITLNAGQGGSDTFAAITGNDQTIKATGDVHINGGRNFGDSNGARIGAPGSTASGTKLTLEAHDIVLKGGDTDSGAAIGNSANSPGLPGAIKITATGNIELDSGLGNGARIGAPNGDSGGGTVDIDATGSIALNGGAHGANIRTADDLILYAASISETGKGRIEAHSLSLTTPGTADLGGDNTIAVLSATTGAMTLANAGPLSVSSLVTSGALVLDNAGTLTLEAAGARDALIQSQGGQSISADALVLHASDGRTAAIGNSTGDQSLHIGAGGIELAVLNGQGAANIFNNSGTGAQSVETTGNLTVQAGAMPTNQTNSGIFQFQSGAQSVSAASIALHGSDVGSNGGAFITNSNGGGAQAIESSGAITITGGGSTGSANRAGIFASGNQTMDARDIVLTGGDNGSSSFGLSNSAQINTNGAQQTIHAASITVNAGQAGTDTFATITGSNQLVCTTGDVSINGGGGIGSGNGARIGGTSGPTNLTLYADNVFLNSGTTTGVGLGSQGSGTQPNTISVHARGDVVLNSSPGNGARIGSGSGGVAAGDISVSAGGSILLNGVGRPAAVRTSGDVTLDAGIEVSELGSGAIIAGSLAATSGGAMLLGGANQISSFNATSGGDLLLNNSGPLSITGVAAGGALALSNAGTVKLDASGSTDAIVSSVGGQAISTDALLVHVEDGRLARIVNNGGAQAIGIGAGGIDLEVVDGAGSAQIVNARGGVIDGTQDVSTTGLLNVVGGSTSNGSGAFNSGVFQSQTGKQTVTAGSISLQAARALVSTGGALIINTDGGPSSDQEVKVASGTIRLTGGGIGFNNRAGIQTSGNQTITGNADIFLTGGSSGTGTNSLGTANSALITAGKTQTIGAHDLTLQAGSGGTDTFAAIIANNQAITATGDVSLTGGANDGSANGARIGASGSSLTGTHVDLRAHNVTIKGGTSNSGATIGNSSTAAKANLANEIKITASGDVVVESGDGNGARIGAPSGDSGAGTIDIEATGTVALEGGAHGANIRTAGDLIVHAASISETDKGRIEAHSLSLTLPGAADLGGDNAISLLNATTSDIYLANTGALEIGSLQASGASSVHNAGAVTLSGFWNAPSVSLSTTGPGADFVVAGSLSSFGAMTLDVNGSLAVTARNGGNAMISQSGLGGQTINVIGGSIDVQTLEGGGSAAISASGSQVINVVNGDHFSVSATAGGSAFVSAFDASPTEPGSQTISLIGAGRNAFGLGSTGAFGFSTMTASMQSITAGRAGEQGSITVTGGLGGANLAVSEDARASQTLSTSGAFTVQSDGFFAQVGGSGRQSIAADSLHLLAQNGASAIIVNQGGDQTISVGAGGIEIGQAGALGSTAILNVPPFVPPPPPEGLPPVDQPPLPPSNGMQNVATTGDLAIAGGGGIFQSQTGIQTVTAANMHLRAGAAPNQGAFISASAGGEQTIDVEHGEISVDGGTGGAGNRASISSLGNQTINGNADIVVAGGAGTQGSASIGATGIDASQSIRANSITVKAGDGSDASAVITARHQEIHAIGDVQVEGSAGGGSVNGARIGGSSGASDLHLYADNVFLTGGAANGVGLGSSVLISAANTIMVEASGDVVLQAGDAPGAGSRIGTSARVPVAGGDISVIAGRDIALNGNAQAASIRTTGDVSLQAGRAISEAGNSSILAASLTTSSGTGTTLGGANQVSSFTAAAGGDVLLNNTSALLSLGSMTLPAGLTVVQAGDLAIGDSAALSPTTVMAAGPITLSSTGATIVRGSDVAAGAASCLVAGGLLDVQAGSFSLVGGAAASAPAVAAGNVVNVATAGDLTLTGGLGSLSPALLLGTTGLDLTLGGTLRIDGGSDDGSFARVATATRDGEIHITFTNAAGDYVVDGFDGRIKHGEDGFYVGPTKPAQLGDTLEVEYGP